MELMYPFAIFICLICGAFLLFGKKFNKEKYLEGKKVANTQFIKETDYYKKKIKKYKILSISLKILSTITIISMGVLIARPITVQVKSEEKYNRDILIGLDISTSESKVNLELINKFLKIMPDIKGDRIGIIIFNTAPVVYCPLTEDYEYIEECFETIKTQLQLVINNNSYVPTTYEVDGEKVPTIWYGGVALNSIERGSSLVGDGLARNCIFIS